MDPYDRNAFTPPPGNYLCGQGPCDPFLRDDANALATSRFSTGRFLSQPLACSADDLAFRGGAHVQLFGYGVHDAMSEETGYPGLRADESHTNCTGGGALVGRGQALMTKGLAVQLGKPYVPMEGAATELYPKWLRAYEKQVQETLAASVYLQMTHSNIGLLFRLGSLLSHGSVFGPVQGEPPPRVACGHVCGAQLKHQGMTFATCALEIAHTEDQHRDGTIIWNDEGARQLANRPISSIVEPKAFSPFLISTVLGGSDAAYGKVAVHLRMGSAGFVIGNDPCVPTSIHDSRGVAMPTRVAVPVRVWLFGHPFFIPNEIMCGVPTRVHGPGPIMQDFPPRMPGEWDPRGYRGPR